MSFERLAGRHWFGPALAGAAAAALVVLALGAGLGDSLWPRPAAADPKSWKHEWPKTDFSKHSVAFSEIFSGGPPKDGIPAIDAPVFASAEAAAKQGLAETEPVIAVAINGDVRAYPLRVLMWHEIVNDTVGGVPVAVTFCPLCNSAIVFDRRLEGKVYDFGTTGKLRNSDLVMYDRQTESWWQQFLGEGIIGEMTGKRLKMLPVRVESFARFRARGVGGKVLVPGEKMRGRRRYGTNPYAHYDSQSAPFLYRGPMPKDIPPLSRVVVVGDEAWALGLLREKRKVERGDLVLTWTPGQNSALDEARIAEGHDIGNVVVQRKTSKGLVDAVYDVSFAFAFHAFHPKGVIHVK